MPRRKASSNVTPRTCILQRRGEADDAVCLALARDDCLRSRSAAVAVVPVQHVNAAASDILIMTRTPSRHMKCRWRFVVCPVTTIISCFRRDARVATEGAE
jgi:hypothetical protein